jgi:hypothetical protein
MMEGPFPENYQVAMRVENGIYAWEYVFTDLTMAEQAMAFLESNPQYRFHATRENFHFLYANADRWTFDVCYDTTDPNPIPPSFQLNKPATKIEIDSGLRLGEFLTVAQHQDADGYPEVGLKVAVHDPVRNTTGRGVIENLDLKALYIYVAVEWDSMKA